MIYLDNASTTKPAEEVLEIYQEAQKALFLIVRVCMQVAKWCERP